MTLILAAMCLMGSAISNLHSNVLRAARTRLFSTALSASSQCACDRLEAMQCLGLYCLLEGIPRPEGQVAALRAGLVWQQPQAEAGEGDTEAEEAAIRVVAARALCDWALIK